MATRTQQLRFFTDENVPDSIGDYLQRRGHSVYRAKSHLPEGTPDPVVATTAMEADRILVTIDKDFNDQRFQKPRFAKLSRIGLSGPGPTLLAAVKKHIRFIEFSWGEKVRLRHRRIILFVKIDGYRLKT